METFLPTPEQYATYQEKYGISKKDIEKLFKKILSDFKSDWKDEYDGEKEGVADEWRDMDREEKSDWGSKKEWQLSEYSWSTSKEYLEANEEEHLKRFHSYVNDDLADIEYTYLLQDEGVWEVA